MKFDSVFKLIVYYRTHYGEFDRVRIEVKGMKPSVFYWWEPIPDYILKLPVTKFQGCREVNRYGLYERELNIFC